MGPRYRSREEEVSGGCPGHAENERDHAEQTEQQRPRGAEQVLAQRHDLGRDALLLGRMVRRDSSLHGAQRGRGLLQRDAALHAREDGQIMTNPIVIGIDRIRRMLRHQRARRHPDLRERRITETSITRSRDNR